MARLARIVIPGWVHHVTQRGNRRQTVFFADHDRLVYLALLARCLSSHDISLIGYTLMDNHVHLAVIPARESSLAMGIGRMHHDFARWQNVQRNQNGHLWQNRFFSCAVEEVRVWGVLAYIELNPVRARMVPNAWDWEWSSAGAHARGTDPTGLLNMSFWERTFTPERWMRYLEEMAAEKEIAARIRSATATGRLLGDEATARRLEQELGRPLLPRRRGRKSRSGQQRP
jgi:putative transposase